VRLTPENYSLSELISQIEDGEIALPEFQRDFIWRPPAIADLLRTVARHWPAGTFLLLQLEGPAPFATKVIDGAPPASSPKVLILDGQQRSTAVYHAFTERGTETYYVEMGAVRAAGEFDDDHLKFMKSTRFSRQYADLEAMAAQRVAKVALLADDTEFNRWMRYIPDHDEQDDMTRIRQDLLPGLREYAIPAVRLKADIPLAAIAKIFETINRTGVRLATFDLMVARLYPHDFKLRDKWEEARAKNDEFAALEISDGIEILKVIALREHLRQREADQRPLTVKGVRESDVLSLPADVVIGNWSAAVEAYVAAIRFVRSRCGVIRRNLLPSSTLLLPFADVLAPDRAKRAGLEDDLTRFFWATAFGQTYAQGANTQAVTDARALRAWQADSSAVPSGITAFRLDPELLGDDRRRNEMMLRGLLCRTIVANARDWMADSRFQDLDGPLEFHHVFPAEYLKRELPGAADPVVNYALLTEGTNRALRDTLPKDVLARSDISAAAIGTHGIDVALFRDTDGAGNTLDHKTYLERFLNGRVSALEAAVYEAVGISKPTP
jgi:hypothetical protein